MGNRRKSKHERDQRRLGDSPGGFGGAGGFGPLGGLGAPGGLAGFNQMARTSCSECGAGIEWLTGAEATQRGIDLDGALEFMGVSEVTGRDVWVCTRCDNFGVMGPPEFGF